MAEEIERYRAQVNFQHKFQNVRQNFYIFSVIRSPTFFVRNIPFRLHLFNQAKGICCALVCEPQQPFDLRAFLYLESPNQNFSLNVECQLSVITPKTIQPAGFSCNFKHGTYFNKTVLSEIFPGEAIIVDDAITITLSILADEPEGITGYNPPKKRLQQELQISGSEVQANFGRLFNSGDFSDVTFVASLDSSKVKAHKAILAAQSDVLARMLTADAEIKIDDIGGPALKIMLRHVYTGQLEFPKGIRIDLKVCQELVNAGEKYDLQNLKKYAAMAMTEFVSLENAWELFTFAKRLKAEAATKALTAYYLGNVHKIMEKI